MYRQRNLIKFYKMQSVASQDVCLAVQIKALVAMTQSQNKYGVFAINISLGHHVNMTQDHARQIRV